jgi:DNA-binding winged helix-turn-helix (wHTH) protein/tetratricopeptide (TPR) repeat protein
MRPATDLIERPSGPIRLREWVLYADRNLLESDGDTRRLEPKAVDVLALLVARVGEVVSKDELIDRVWESRIISEGTLTNTIAELRRALGDDARDPCFIETIPKRGYRLICPVEHVQATADRVPVVRRTRRRWAIAAALVIAAGAAAAVVHQRLAAPRLRPDSVFAASFVNRTGEPGLDALSSLARDRIVGELTGSGIAQPLPDSGDSPAATVDAVCRRARSVGAALAVTGAFYLHEGEVEVQAQLVDVSEGELLYAVHPIIGSSDEVSASVDVAVQRVLGALATHLTAHAHFTLLARPPVFEAYREFIAGSEVFVADLPAAIRHLERAVAIDPQFTSARFRLAMAYKAALRAPEGRALLDGLHDRRGELTEFERVWLDAFVANFEGRWHDTLTCLNRALEMAPNDWTILYLIGSHELRLNRPRHVVESLEELHGKPLPGFVVRHPFYAASYASLAVAYHQLDDHRRELAAAREGRELFPTDSGLMRAEARALAAQGDVDALAGVVGDARTASGKVELARLLAAAAASAGAHGHPSLETDLSEQAVAAIINHQEGEIGGDAAHALGRALAALGRLDDAQHALERAVSSFSGQRRREATTSLGWLGVVAARRGDVDTADAMDRELAAMEDPYLYGYPEYYRAAIAAWRGQRGRAVGLLRRARSIGWGGYHLLHDDERLLFEPLEGEPAYRAMLVPAD